MLYKSIYLMLTCFFLILTGCKDIMSDSTETATKAPKIVNEVGALSKLISLPNDPVSVRWLEPDPNNKESAELLALIEFHEGDYAEIVKNSPNFDLIQDDKMPEPMFNEWVPASVAAAIETKQENGMVVMKGINALKPNLFIKAKASPFIHGAITPLGAGYIFVYLYTM